MRDRASRSLDDEILAVERERAKRARLIHRLKGLVRDASTSCEIDGYRLLQETDETVEWLITRGDVQYRLMLLRQP